MYVTGRVDPQPPEPDVAGPVHDGANPFYPVLPAICVVVTLKVLRNPAGRACSGMLIGLLFFNPFVGGICEPFVAMLLGAIVTQCTVLLSGVTKK